VPKSPKHNPLYFRLPDVEYVEVVVPPELLSDTEYVDDPDFEYTFQLISSFEAFKLSKFIVTFVPVAYWLPQPRLPAVIRENDPGNE
jgi:hypothetical protein